ncbi:hypothetical protein Tsubulata_034429 [Turnera subulata]|uniref:Uncharacterized protein n=1 Tax=Turnera subulata TaxID=218843 RepID=A0A9Q0G807_9ROSI|nr:hypothetical protein Tsubulata_034429 [Turnera subulata]
MGSTENPAMEDSCFWCKRCNALLSCGVEEDCFLCVLHCPEAEEVVVAVVHLPTSSSQICGGRSWEQCTSTTWNDGGSFHGVTRHYTKIYMLEASQKHKASLPSMQQYTELDA